jgi:hypothetical protein
MKKNPGLVALLGRAGTADPPTWRFAERAGNRSERGTGGPALGAMERCSGARPAVIR